jgi:tetratricopeptide (TPR) repeat protein
MSSHNHSHTIFLTSEEAQRLRHTLRGKFQKCQEVEGQLRVSGDPKFRSNQVATASLISDIADAREPRPKTKNGKADVMVAFAMGDPYPPCTAVLQDLKPIKLSDLRMNRHHRGRVITVRRIAPVVKLVAYSWTVIQEESSNETERLEVLLHKSKYGQDILESSSTFKIKEPYFTLSDEGDQTLRIDHPSDLHICTGDLCTGNSLSSTKENSNYIGAVLDTSSPEFSANSARVCKEEGNTALKQQVPLQAHAKYTQGLHMIAINGTLKEKLASDLFRNRAYVNLVLKRYDGAKADALASITGLEDQKHKDLDSKAYFRAGCAAYNLGEFEEAKDFFEAQRRLSYGDKDAIASLETIDLRLQEQNHGLYDFRKIKLSLLSGRLRVDAADFTRNTKVRESHGRGRGLFATRDMESGDIILCEKSFCVVWGHENEALTTMTYDGRDDRIRVFPAGLCKAVVEKLLSNASQVDKVMDLHSNYQGIGNQLIIRDFNPVVDVFQVHDIVARNAFGPGPVHTGGHCGEEDTSMASTGIWITASYANHSCIPNAKKEYIGDLMVLRASRKISADEEITHSYDESSDYDARAAALMTTWGFACSCQLCIAEKTDGLALRKKRQELENEANTFIESHEAIGRKRLSILKAQRLARSINDTYDNERYKDIPRTGLFRIQKWLAEARHREVP